MSKKKIVVIGSCNTDMVVKSDRLPAPGETVLGGAFMMNPGGKGANQAVAVARLGGNVTFISKTGNDLFGKQSVEMFDDEKINTDFIFSDPNHPSGVALIMVDAHGNEWRSSTVSEQAYNNNYYNVDLHTDYEKLFSKGHYFKLMGGVQSEGNLYRDLYVSRDGIIDPTIPAINTTTGLGLDGKVSIPDVSGAYYNWAVVGFFGRLNYNYNEKYLLEANLRYDGSSRFRANNRWGLFPSFSAGWNVSKEKLFKSLSNTIETLKFRASYGSLGNQNTSNLYPTYEIMGYIPGI